MIKHTTFLKAATTTLTACLLAACGGDSSNSNNDSSPKQDIKYKLSLVSSDAGKTGIMGESIYSINVKDLDGNAVYGETPTLKPMMKMVSGMNHSAPHLGCTRTNDKGVSDCTTYFPMASMMNGEKMGTWTVGVELANADTFSFSPSVTMPMSETPRVVLKDKEDTIDNLPRNYLVFNNVSSNIMMAMATPTHSVKLFIASKESMMNFPVLATNTVLSKDTADELSVDSIEVEVSSDTENWIKATAGTNGTGIWTADIEGYKDTFYVKLSVNSSIKMSGSNDYATFKKMSSMSGMSH